ncbi:hypothetical protein Q0F99_08385 [Rathayibacter oskolensis]|nr:hypothetical protein [Rathayibacter oskolensis]WKK72876.1 hypothetical protein Q0F99_08385 [Rathayibacter oskolensis]
MSPRPPMVASNSSTFSVGVQRDDEPSLRTSVNDTTWRPSVPAEAWFLPCTSFAIAPASVTFLVPGVTGSIQPRGENTACTSLSSTPGSARSTPVSSSKASRRSNPLKSQSTPPPLSATSP